MILIVFTNLTGVLEKCWENFSAFPFVYVTILFDKLFRLMGQLFSSPRAIDYKILSY